MAFLSDQSSSNSHRDHYLFTFLYLIGKVLTGTFSFVFGYLRRINCFNLQACCPVVLWVFRLITKWGYFQTGWWRSLTSHISEELYNQIILCDSSGQYFAMYFSQIKCFLKVTSWKFCICTSCDLISFEHR